MLAVPRVVYLHCRGGQGRAGTVGALLLACLHPDAGAARVLACVQAGFASRFLGPPPPGTDLTSPETAEQANYVRAVATQLAAAAVRAGPG